MESPKLQENMNPDQDLFSEAKICRELYKFLDLSSEQQTQQESHLDNNHGGDETDEEDEEVEQEEEEFSFMAFGADGSPVAAEDAFVDGQIKPVFPFFNTDLLLSEDDLPAKVPVDKVFVELPERNNDQMRSPSSSGNDEISGPYCDWTRRKAVEVGTVAHGEGCKKSNSTGFSKIWRFKELIGRSNSDGRDTFVFFNEGGNVQPQSKAETVVVKGKEKEKKTGKVIKKVGGTTKGKTTPALSPYEVYLKSKAKEEERRRPSYLPYRPDVVGFFTNANGGLSKNVHPY